MGKGKGTEAAKERTHSQKKKQFSRWVPNILSKQAAQLHLINGNECKCRKPELAKSKKKSALEFFGHG